MNFFHSTNGMDANLVLLPPLNLLIIMSTKRASFQSDGHLVFVAVEKYEFKLLEKLGI